MLFKLWPQPPLDNAADLKKDPLIVWQDRHIHLLAVIVSFILPTLVGFMWDGWVGALAGFLIGGVAKVVMLQHCTFLINSACHTLGRQPYSTRCSARDSLFMALFTFGGLPQLSSRISARLSKRREVLAMGPDQMADLDSIEAKLDGRVAPSATGNN